MAARRPRDSPLRNGGYRRRLCKSLFAYIVDFSLNASKLKQSIGLLPGRLAEYRDSRYQSCKSALICNTYPSARWLEF